MISHHWHGHKTQIDRNIKIIIGIHTIAQFNKNLNIIIGIRTIKFLSIISFYAQSYRLRQTSKYSKMEFTQGEGQREGEGFPNCRGTRVDPTAEEEAQCDVDLTVYTGAATPAWIQWQRRRSSVVWT
jgi:hypothetical protein